MLAKGNTNIKNRTEDIVVECMNNIDMISQEIFSKFFPDVDISEALSMDDLLKKENHHIHQSANSNILPLYEIKI